MQSIEEARESVAAEVRAGLARRSISRQAAAEALGISRASLHDRLTGRRAFNTDNLIVLSALIDVSIADLFADDLEPVQGTAS